MSIYYEALETKHCSAANEAWQHQNTFEKFGHAEDQTSDSWVKSVKAISALCRPQYKPAFRAIILLLCQMKDYFSEGKR